MYKKTLKLIFIDSNYFKDGFHGKDPTVNHEEVAYQIKKRHHISVHTLRKKRQRYERVTTNHCIASHKEPKETIPSHINKTT